MAAAEEEEFAEVELEVAAILCDLKRILRARDRRRRRRQRQEEPEIPKWGRRRLRSVLEDNKPAPAASVAERDDGAASPDTPLAFPESGGDDAPPEAEEDAKKARSRHDEWMQEQHGVVATLSQENLHLLKQIEEYRARLQSSRSTNESLKQLHKVRRQREEHEQALKLRTMAPCSAPGLVLDLNEPARVPEVEEDGDAAAARAMAMAEEWHRQWQRVALQKAAVTAEARRRRLEILRAKVASPLVSSRMRRVG